MRVFATILALLMLSGCATDYVARTSRVRSAYEVGNYPAAMAAMEEVEKEKRPVDELLILLDKGMVLHAAGRYAESIEVLKKADALSQRLDVVSVSQEAASLITSERERAYKGEDFEKLMISVLQALNFAKLGDEEGALVEVRRVNERLSKMVSEEKKPYEQLAIARYLGGILYEDQGEWDSAIIDYQFALKLQPRMDHLAEPLLRLARKTGRDDLYDRLKRQFPGVRHEPLGPDEGQVVVIIEAGKAPQKRSTESTRQSQLIVIPQFYPRSSSASIRVKAGNQLRSAVTVTALSQVAQKHLSDRIGRMLAQQFAGAAVKAGVAVGVAQLTKSEAAGALTFYLLALSNQPDLRSWLSLPADFQLARFRLPAGKHQVEITFNGRTTTHTVEVEAQRIALVVERRY